MTRDDKATGRPWADGPLAARMGVVVDAEGNFVAECDATECRNGATEIAKRRALALVTAVNKLRKVERTDAAGQLERLYHDALAERDALRAALGGMVHRFGSVTDGNIDHSRNDTIMIIVAARAALGGKGEA